MAREPQRKTRQRALILEALRKTKSHPTATEVYNTVRKILPTISLGTVYRNLDRLTQTGEAQKLEWGGVEARYDADTKNHYHVRCVQCGRVDDLPHPPINGEPEAPFETAGYQIMGHRLEFVGLCPECQKHKKRSDDNVESQD